MEEQKALFVKAGELLAPKCFMSTLSRPVSAVTEEDQSVIQTQLDDRTLAMLQDKEKRLKDYNHAKQNTEEHVKRLNGQNSRERSLCVCIHRHKLVLILYFLPYRCRTWANLAKATRTRGIWDVALLASMFCLQYESEGGRLNQHLHAFAFKIFVMISLL